MTETFTVLMIAHVLADFVFQTRWIVDNKHRPPVLLLHGMIVFGVMLALFGPACLAALLTLAVVHLGIDLAKLGARRGALAPFLVDQAAHVVSIAAIAITAPDMWRASPLAALPDPAPAVLLHAGLIGAGFVAVTRVGGLAVGLLMSAPAWHPPGGGLHDGGRIIGLLERGLIFILLLAGQYDAIGFLIAAKSILRFGTVAEDRAISEYVIIGTLASFGWAIAVTLAMLALQGHLPPLVLPPSAP